MELEQNLGINWRPEHEQSGKNNRCMVVPSTCGVCKTGSRVRVHRRVLDSCGIAANIATAESLAAEFGNGGVASGADVTDIFGKGALGGARSAGLAQELATARRFVAEQQFVCSQLRQTHDNRAVSTIPLEESSLMVCTGSSTSTLG